MKSPRRAPGPRGGTQPTMNSTRHPIRLFVVRRYSRHPTIGCLRATNDRSATATARTTTTRASKSHAIWNTTATAFNHAACTATPNFQWGFGEYRCNCRDTACRRARGALSSAAEHRAQGARPGTEGGTRRRRDVEAKQRLRPGTSSVPGPQGASPTSGRQRRTATWRLPDEQRAARVQLTASGRRKPSLPPLGGANGVKRGFTGVDDGYPVEQQGRGSALARAFRAAQCPAPRLSVTHSAEKTLAVTLGQRGRDEWQPPKQRSVVQQESRDVLARAIRAAYVTRSCQSSECFLSYG